ncbi:ABC transporter substrate-binding protein [Microbacterium sp. SORGH_AS_0888]|uniref:ABC transporter substrate-binding protein n=1 Tax=Microbacterium sp. SORGH_AS_0888 TaxID=3041791 RepID=UPI00277FE6B9|nr:ABC transporter substrate-binding protein [Microbacterium sp. SORGH_AS_0888]MDQ1130536.1 peptide/nickel transport system substrate-binding protein [Microbacterium sp. SORGH_AS_0888]
MNTRRPRRLIALVAPLIATLLLAGCTAGTAPGQQGSETPHSGGQLVHAVPALADGWQQQQSNNWYKSQVWTQLVETLVYVDDTGTVHPWLADSWTSSADGLTYTLEIHPGVSFSDGTALTASTVAHNLNVLGLGEPDKGLTRAPLIPVEFQRAEATGELTVQVTLTSPNEGFIPSLGFFAAGMLSDATLDLPVEQQAKLENVVGTGPFVLESQTPGQRIVLKRRDDYGWASPAFSHSGPAYLERIVFVAVAEDASRLGALESGQADSIHYVQPTEEERLETAGWDVIRARYFGTPINFVLRPQAQIVDDVRVRRAIQSGIDRQELVDTIYNGSWHPATSAIQQASPGWVDLSGELAYDPDAAKRLLDEAGWVVSGGDGIRTRDGERLSLTAYTSPNLNTSSRLLELVSQQLAAIGIELSIRQTDATSYGDVFNAATTQLIPTANTFLDAATLKQYWGSTAADQFHLAGEATEASTLDPLLLALTRTAPGTPERAAAAEAVQRAVVSAAYTVPLVDNYQVYVASAKVHGIVTNAVGRPYFYDVWKSS